MSPDTRRRKILDLLKAQDRLTVGQIAELMDVSQETIRRDLHQLSTDGLLLKFHGGASLPTQVNAESAFRTRMHEQSREKQRIAERAAALFGPGDTIFIDTGSTTVFFARALAEKRGLTIITNSVQIATTLRPTQNKLFLIGGDYLPDAEETVGVLAIEQIRRFNAEHAVITVGALGVEGAMDFSLEEAEIARSMVGQAQTLTVLADSAKFDRRALFPVFPLQRINRLVTDHPPEGELCRRIVQCGIDLLADEVD